PGMPIYSQILSRNLDKNIKNGRIYRLVHETTVRGPQPKMLDEPAVRLVTYLDHPNGWWRDNAQKELIVRGDQSVIPALIELVSGKKGLLPNEPSALARLHALWTLDGLDAVNKKILF